VVQTETEEPDPVPAPTVTSALARASPQSAAASPDLAPLTVVPPAVVVPPEESTSEPDPDAYAPLPLLRQLSYLIQTALPDLRISVHVYAEVPTDRFVIIQRVQYREGDQLGKDLTLEAITPSGAVLRYQNTEFRINR
jgi:general secretion pathway protein B